MRHMYYVIHATNRRTNKRELVRATDARPIVFTTERDAIQWGTKRIGDRVTGAIGWNLKYRQFRPDSVVVVTRPSSQQRSWGF